MPTATLLLREPNTTSLSAIVEKSQQKPLHPLLEYELKLRSCQLDLIPIQKSKNPSSSSATTTSGSDEGFESDIDSLSIVSSDDSFTTTTNVNQKNVSGETDSANGSACSDTDEEIKEINENQREIENETYELVNCLCYSDVKSPDVLVFVIKSDALVFKFGNLEDLEKFYTNFNTLKAVTNQKAYGKEVGKFNLLQRIDDDGVTHIEIKKEMKIDFDFEYLQNHGDEKVPKKPERRKKLKGKAPPPPNSFKTNSFQHQNCLEENQNVLKGEYIRVNVPKIDVITEKLNQTSLNNHFNIYQRPKLTSYQQFKFIAEEKSLKNQNQQKRFPENWSCSMPRLKFRSKSETRIFQQPQQPISYRYVDAKNYCNSPIYIRKYNQQQLQVQQQLQQVQQVSQQVSQQIQPVSVSISNRLFGMTGKLKDFSNLNDFGGMNEVNRWNSLGELSVRNRNQIDSSLKSVIKKEDAKKKEKKVTFSAYATVQVV